MKIQSKYMSKVLTTVLVLCGLSLVMSSCRRQVATIAGGENTAVIFRASVGTPQNDTRLTPSDLVDGGEFEVGDSVGLYLFDQNTGGASSAYSFVNAPYVASLVDGNVMFAPADGPNSVFYKTFYLHNVYAYYPFSKVNSTSTTAASVAVNVKTDQTLATQYALSDFLTCRLVDVKPQQIDPAAPELDMNFDHQFTSVVVKVRNGDNSAILPTPVVSIINMATSATADITGSAPIYSQLGNVLPVVVQQNVDYVDVNFPTQLCFKGIIIPQAFTLGKSVIKVKVGTGTTARVYEYAPTVGDPIYAAGGFAQGKEHLLDFVISGTELIVQGGEVVDWGEGSKSITEIDGGGQSASKMIFEVTNDTGDAQSKVASFKSASLTIDGKVRVTTKLEYNSGVVPSVITCNYYQGDDWGYDFQKIEFKDAAGVVQMTCIPTSSLRIKGNPLDQNYATVIAVIDAQTGVITAK